MDQMVAVYVFDIHLYGGALIYTLKGRIGLKVILHIITSFGPPSCTLDYKVDIKVIGLKLSDVRLL